MFALLQKKALTRKVAKLSFTILIFPILILPFNFSVFANENLIDSDLRNWDIIYPDYTSVLYKRDNEFLIRVKPFPSETNPDVKLSIGGVYHLSDLVNGNSYTLNFKYLSPSQMGVGDALANAPYLNGGVAIGLASKIGDKYELIENACITINKDNYLDYYGKNFSINFKMDNIINPCIIFYYMGAGMGYEIYFGVGDVSLIDNDASKEDNFFARLFEWFENKFKQLFNVLLYLDPDGEEDYNNPFAPNDNDVNGADNLEYLQNGINKFVESVENLTLYLRVPSEMLTTLGNHFPIIPIIVVFTLVGLVVMRLFGVRRDS